MSIRSLEQLEVVLQQLDSEYPGWLIIDQLEKLHDFISPVPDLAWEIMEDSEKRLLVEFDNAKPRWQPLLGSNQRISLMLNKLEELKRPLRENGGVLWCQPVDYEAVDDITADSEINGSKALDPERRFWLGPDSQIKVL